VCVWQGCALPNTHLKQFYTDDCTSYAYKGSIIAPRGWYNFKSNPLYDDPDRRRHMSQDRTRKIVVTGVLSAISIFLGLTRLGFWPWFGGVSITVMHVPVIIGAVLEGPLVGLAIGLIFGLFSMIQAAVAPNTPADVWFTNPLLAVLPRLFIGPVAWLAWNSLKRWPIVGLAAAGIAGSLTNTILVLGMIGVLGYLPWAALVPIAVANGVPEVIVSALLVVVVCSVYWGINVGRKPGANI
jgi:uncharacterized membrane protein